MWLPVTTLSANRMLRTHPLLRAKSTADHRALARMASWKARAVPLPIVVTFTRYAPGRLDDDNLRMAFKAMRDGIADRLGLQDNDPRITWAYEQGERTVDYGVRIDVEARP